MKKMVPVPGPTVAVAVAEIAAVGGEAVAGEAVAEWLGSVGVGWSTAPEEQAASEIVAMPAIAVWRSIRPARFQEGVGGSGAMFMLALLV